MNRTCFQDAAKTIVRRNNSILYNTSQTPPTVRSRMIIAEVDDQHAAGPKPMPGVSHRSEEER